MNKKNLDTLFQEKFKGFKEKPDEKVWKSIEASLDKKKNAKRAIPLWWKLGGIAALLAVLFLVMDPFTDPMGQNDATITDTEKTTEEKTQQEDGKMEEQSLDFGKGQNGVVDTELKETPLDEDPVPEDQKPALVGTEDVPSKRVPRGTEKGKDGTLTNLTPTGESGIATSDKGEDFEKNRSQASRNQDIMDKGLSKKEGFADSGADPTREKELDGISKDSVDRGKKRAGNVLGDHLNPSQEEGVAQREKTAKDTLQPPQKKSIFDEIKAQEEDQAIAEATDGRWSAGPSIAPVYYNAIGTGSPVHSIFVPNSKSGDINLSYGLQVAYEINDRLSVRSGIHRVDFGYDTNDVEFSSSLQASNQRQIDNIDYTLTARNLVVESKANGVSSTVGDQAFNLAEVSAPNPSRDGTMSQQFGYVEVPVELNYALVDRKFGVNLIGGLSSLFLVDNSVTLTSGGLTTEMGEANNINPVNFSTNIGFGLNYSFSPKLRLNVEPIFKYQLNTFSETAGNFQPFTIGVYSGLSLRF